MCILTLDFEHAFDRVSHDYLFTILRSYGLSAHFVTLIRNLYTGATSSVQINGRLHGPIPTRCGVQQGCPLSMALYTLSTTVSQRVRTKSTLCSNRSGKLSGISSGLCR